jgi:hypothetical protein
MNENSKIKLPGRQDINLNKVVSKEEQQMRLSGHNVDMCCSSLDIDNNEQSEDVLNELADIFVESILWEINNGTQNDSGSDLLPGVHKRTG